ncbi:MAG: mechanosensitive ion channel, partial [Clostridia bacterium]|nr:mechanosensitive ion channel [Clostridia bacterium]
MENFLTWIVGVAQTVGLKLLAALLTWIIGSLIIKGILKIFPNGKKFEKMDPTVKSFLNSFVNIGLWVILIVCIVAILGVPMASVIAAIASCGVAIGLAMQGSLSNLAGGIMLLLFRPFSVGEFIETSGVSGTVREIGIFYTLIVTGDNKHVTIPNGTMMNNTVINYSRE